MGSEPGHDHLIYKAGKEWIGNFILIIVIITNKWLSKFETSRILDVVLWNLDGYCLLNLLLFWNYKLIWTIIFEIN